MSIKRGRLLTLWCFHFVSLVCCLRWSDLNVAFHFGNSQFVHQYFAVYRFHSQKQRHNQQQRNKGQKRRTFVENASTFVGGGFVWFHAISVVNNNWKSIKDKLDCRIGCTLDSPQAVVPCSCIRDMPRNNCKEKSISIELSSFGRSLILSCEGLKIPCLCWR